MRKVNLNDLVAAPRDDRPDGYRSAHVSIGPRIGATWLGASIYELRHGESTCPYHYEYGCEEWLLVVSGRPTLRHPEGEDILEPGDVVCFPEGPDGAHKITNTFPDTARVVILSDKRTPNIAFYPDSDKVGVWTGHDDGLLTRRESAVDYWDGEA